MGLLSRPRRLLGIACVVLSAGCRGGAGAPGGQPISGWAHAAESQPSRQSGWSDLQRADAEFQTVVVRETAPEADVPAEAPSAAVKLAGYEQSSTLAAPAAPSDEVAPLPLGVSLNLDQAIATSLARNPTLVSMRAADPVAQAACGVAETYPWNPFVQIQVLPYARNRAGQDLAVSHYVLLTQTLEFAHQQDHREASAAATLNQVRWNIVQGELTTMAQAERLYFTALYQRELRDLARQAESLNAELLAVVDRRFEAGLSTPPEQTTVRVTARQSHQQAELAEANYQTALLALRRQLNLCGSQPLDLEGRLEDFIWLPVTTAGRSEEPLGIGLPIDPSFVAELAAARPDVRAAGAGTCVARANADLADANRVPNLGIGPYYQRSDSGTVSVGFRAQTNVPVWDTGRPLALQREAEFMQQAVGVQQLRSQAMLETHTALERYQRARQLAEQARRDAAQAPAEEWQRIRDLFQAGQASILDVIAVQNALLQEQRTRFDLLNELAQSAADVTQFAALPPSRLITTYPSTSSFDAWQEAPPQIPPPGESTSPQP